MEYLKFEWDENKNTINKSKHNVSFEEAKTVFQGGDPMREEYNFSNARKNPYIKKEKQQITINLDRDVIDYFKGQSGSSGIPYQTLINLYLSDCVTQKRELQLSWK